MSIHYAETQYGFEYGSALVERHAYVAREGHGSTVVIGVTSPKHCLQINVTKTGRMRVLMDGKEIASA